MPPYPIGAILIARLAVDLRYQGQRLGSQLLGEALRRAVAASDAAAARLVVVDAIDDDAAAFYRRWGFIDTPDNPRRLYLKMSDVRASIAPFRGS
jgi:predicted N-acetyltransferase YhbS